MQGRGNQGLTFGDHFAEYNLLARFYQRGGRPADMLLQRQDHLLRRGDNLYRRIRREFFLLGRVHTMGVGSRTGEQPQNTVVLMVFLNRFSISVPVVSGQPFRTTLSRLGVRVLDLDQAAAL